MTFQFKRSVDLPNMKAVYQEFEDDKTGAKHIHVKTESKENSFMVSFPTIPDKNDGRAHILEHLTLQGSRKFPVKSPFSVMTSRSLATFMNAMTDADMTMYPFSSIDEKDYMNLMDVYLDATFFPLLTAEQFQQEGWRYDFDENGQLIYTGVVFNEMKEPSVNPDYVSYRKMTAITQQGTTYAQDSGGDPLSIPDLTRQDLIEFHKTHYHPSRCTFWSYGSMDVEKIQEKITSNVLDQFSDRLSRIVPESVKDLPSGSHEITIPSDESIKDQNYAYFACRNLGDIKTKPDELELYSVFSWLMGGYESSPLKQALKSTGFGGSISVELNDSTRTHQWIVGQEGLTEDQCHEVKEIIQSVLNKVANEGFPKDLVESVLRDIEYEELSESSQGMTVGVNTLISMAKIELHDGDPVKALSYEKTLALLKNNMDNPEFFKELARSCLAMPVQEIWVKPDVHYVQNRVEKEKERLAKIQEQLTPDDVEQIIQNNQILNELQDQEEDLSVMPIIELKDISKEVVKPYPTIIKNEEVKAILVDAPLNGLARVELSWDVTGVDKKDWPMMMLMSRLLFSVGVGDLDYADAEMARQKKGVWFSSMVDFEKANNQGTEGVLSFKLTGESFEREMTSSLDVLVETIQEVNFNDRERLSALIQAQWTQLSQKLPKLGNGYTLEKVKRSLHFEGAECKDIKNELSFLNQCKEWLSTDEGFKTLVMELDRVRKEVLQTGVKLVLMGDAVKMEEVYQEAKKQMKDFHAAEVLQGKKDLVLSQKGGFHPGKSVAITGPGQLNYCYAAWQAPFLNERDFPAMLVLAEYLSANHLHKMIREKGGAYGGSASMLSGMLIMSSYRDPRCKETFSDFDSVHQKMITTEISDTQLHESILSVIKELEPKHLPSFLAKRSAHLAVLDVKEAELKELRHQILSCTKEDLKRVAERYLSKPAEKTAYVCKSSLKEAIAMGMEVEDLIPKKETAKKLGLKNKK